MMDQTSESQTGSGSAHVSRSSTSGEKFGRILVSTGRGGTGKSSFIALAARYLPPPMLLLDLDPDQSLADMVGIELEATTIKTEIGREVPIKTISDLSTQIEEEDALTELGGGPAMMKIPLLLKWYSTYQSDKFDLISLGTRWTEGDYRLANYLFEFIIPSIGKNYNHILVDSPAGVEHLNRRVLPHIDDLFLVLDPSSKSMKHLERVKKITSAVDITYDRLYILGNYEFDQQAEQYFQGLGETYLGRIDYDLNVRESNLKGRSLLNLPADSPASQSVKKLLNKAGYPISDNAP
jgi:CO dehydrogenase maturation factor